MGMRLDRCSTGVDVVRLAPDRVSLVWDDGAWDDDRPRDAGSGRPAPKSEADPDEDWDASWDPAIGKASTGQRFLPSGRAKAITAAVLGVAIIATLILLCLAASNIINLILDPVA